MPFLKDLGEIKHNYRTGDDDLISEFYAPCLSHSSLYWRASGYFRSSVYLLVQDPIIDFCRRGGRIRLICSPDLNEDDANAMLVGFEERERQVKSDIESAIERLLQDDETNFRLRVLSTLIAYEVLDIRLAYRPSQKGIFHEKLGIFTDEEGESVSFIGSVNETWSGWNYQGNHESMEVFGTWRGSSDQIRVRNHVMYFERLWRSEVSDLSVLEFPEAQRRQLISYAFDSLEEISVATGGRPGGQRGVKAQEQNQRIEEGKSRERFNLFPHQVNAIKEWSSQSCRGIFEHATGSGKTISALAAMEEHLSDGLPVLVVVPSRLLLEQWIVEVRRFYPEAIILGVGGGHHRWKQAGVLRSMTASTVSDEMRVVVATLQTASSTTFRSLVRAGSHLMIVADEVHQTGSPEASLLFQIDTGKRLGLSATPTRYGDAEGTHKLFDYFGPVVQPPFTLADAISSNRLVPYEYFPRLCKLTEEEIVQWRDLSRRISRLSAWNVDSPSPETSSQIDMLLIQRARIAKKAGNKVSIVLEILKENLLGDDRWLVYCEDREQLQAIKMALNREGIQPLQYFSGMDGSPQAVLDAFNDFGGVLLSIKCLDEGVDIPSINKAIIVASSQNPRQFIQRRGRVLRQSPATNKRMATVFDVLVVPDDLDDNSEMRALFASELARAIEFAKSAINTNASSKLREFCLDAGVDIDDLLTQGDEENQDSESEVSYG